MRKKQWSARQLAAMQIWRKQQISNGSAPRTVSEEMKALGAARQAREEIGESRRLEKETGEVWSRLEEEMAEGLE